MKDKLVAGFYRVCVEPLLHTDVENTGESVKREPLKRM